MRQSSNRIPNIINRAVDEFNFEFDMQDTLQEIFDNAYNCLMDNLDVERIEEAETSNHHSYMRYDDGKGYTQDWSGEIIASEARDNKWYRWNDDKREYVEIPWYDANDDDYVAADYVINSDAEKVLLIVK